MLQQRQIDEIDSFAAQGMTAKEIFDSTKISESTVEKYLKKWRAKNPNKGPRIYQRNESNPDNRPSLFTSQSDETKMIEQELYEIDKKYIVNKPTETPKTIRIDL